MSDEEDVVMSEEEMEDEPTSPVRRAPPPEDSGPSEAELAMKKRREAKLDTSALDEEGEELLEANKALRAEMSAEIAELRARSERRKKEREEEEKQMAERRAEEDTRRKKEEEERVQKKNAEDSEKRDARAAKMAEFEKWKNDSQPNFIIVKKTNIKKGEEDEDEDDEDEQGEKKSKEQLEAEKLAILEQRTPKLNINGFDSSKLTDKAKELHSLIMRLESEKYDLEKRFKAQQYDMMELAERARQMNKVGKEGTLKRVQMTDEADIFQDRFAGCPSKIIMFSQFERQTDQRNWGQRKVVFTGPHVLYAADRIPPCRIVKFNPDNGLPEYEDIPGMEPREEEE